LNQFFCIGDADTCTGFAMSGVQGINPRSSEEALDAFLSAVEDVSITILIITEEIAVRLQDRITEHRMTGKMPMVVEIPENLSGEFQGQSLMDSIKQAIGISI